VTTIEGIVTAAVPAFLILSGYWRTADFTALVLAVFGVLMAVGLWVLTRPHAHVEARRPSAPVARHT
jgi:hypothetical protein